MLLLLATHIFYLPRSRSRSIDPLGWYGSLDRFPDNDLYESDSSAAKLFVRLVAGCGCVLNFHWN